MNNLPDNSLAKAVIVVKIEEVNFLTRFNANPQLLENGSSIQRNHSKDKDKDKLRNTRLSMVLLLLRLTKR